MVKEENNIVNNNRPVNLDLKTMKFPPMAIASILHRLSGIFLFIGMPFVLYLLSLSLTSEQGFEASVLLLTKLSWKLGGWFFLAALTYHLLSGIRHLLMNMSFGEQLDMGRKTAWLVIILAVISFILLGSWIW